MNPLRERPPSPAARVALALAFGLGLSVPCAAASAPVASAEGDGAAAPAASGEPPAGAARCAPWPGEPERLPDTSSPDRISARWAGLRAAELAGLALALEAVRPLDAGRLWRHAACLDPQSEAARAGARRTRPVVVHRPSLHAAHELREPPPRSRSLAIALRGLAAPLALEPIALAPRLPDVAAGPGAPAGAIGLDAPPAGDSPTERLRRATARIEARVATAERMLHAARFEDVIDYARGARAHIEPLAWDAGVRSQLARLEVSVATAQVALGRQDAARESFTRALAADPALQLDLERTPPKVLRAYRAALAEREVEG